MGVFHKHPIDIHCFGLLVAKKHLVAWERDIPSQTDSKYIQWFVPLVANKYMASRERGGPF
jgi:hypothetical protein